MKKCNLCQSTVQAENECPICHNTLTYEPACADTREHYVWSRYLCLFIVKNVWFSVVCCIFGMIRTTLVKPPFRQLLITAAVCALISLTVSVLGQNFERALHWKYTDTYAVLTIGIWKYVLGGISMLLFCFV